MSAPAVVPDAFIIEPEANAEIQKISTETGLSDERIVAIALRMFAIALDAQRKNRKVLVTSDSGYPLEEIIIPKF